MIFEAIIAEGSYSRRGFCPALSCNPFSPGAKAARPSKRIPVTGFMNKNPDLHGNAPDESPVALLLIDVINDFEFPGAELLFKQADIRSSAEVCRSQNRER